MTGKNRSDICYPPRIQELIRVIGYEATTALVKKYGGHVCYIPSKARPSYSLAKVIGMDALEKLTKVYDNQHFDIPMMAGIGLKKMKILSMTGSNSEISAAVGCSSRYVRLVRQNIRPENDIAQKATISLKQQILLMTGTAREIATYLGCSLQHVYRCRRNRR